MTKSSSHGCQRCNKTSASPRSLWNHKQRCRGQSHAENISNNDIREQNVPRKRLRDDCAGLNDAADKTSKLPKNPKIQSLIDEIIDDGSTEDQTTPPEEVIGRCIGRKSTTFTTTGHSRYLRKTST